MQALVVTSYAGISFLGAMSGLVLVGIVHRARLHSKARRLPPAHVHIVDCNRSNITTTDRNGLYLRCSISGCEEPVYFDAATLEWMQGWLAVRKSVRVEAHRL